MQQCELQGVRIPDIKHFYPCPLKNSKITKERYRVSPRNESLPLGLLGIAVPLTILAGGTVAAIVIPHCSLFKCLLLAEILAPIDAALRQDVVSSPVIPVRIRQSLNVKSGLNDGIVLPVVLLTASIAGTNQTTADASS